MIEYTGWLLDVYVAARGGIVLWLLCDDGERRQFHQSFPVTFYAAGERGQLRSLWKYLESQPIPVIQARMQRRDLFAGPTTVMAVQVEHSADQPVLFKKVRTLFPDLTYYDADIELPIRYAAAYGVFPLSRCQVYAGEGGNIRDITPLSSPWELDPPHPPLRILTIAPDADPRHTPPTKLTLTLGDQTRQLPLHPPRPLLHSINTILKRYDPDIILARYGDTWLLPYLLDMAAELEIPFNPNRDTARPVLQRKEHSYWAYGQTVYRGHQVHLFGRWHIDHTNAMLYGEFGLEGVFEQARVTGLPVQTMARNSPGSGITAMQIITALRSGMLVPYQKQQAESYKSARSLIDADRGGLVYQPTLGMHHQVAEIDFTSMYPSIMVHFNISPETVGVPEGTPIPDLDLKVDQTQTGLVPETLRPLLEKRIRLKEKLGELDRRDQRYRLYKARSDALKWLLVVCFGYLGYKNARFGKIESHQAVTAYGREALLRAKEAAEDMGFEVLHLYSDALWVKKNGASQVPDFQPLLDEIVARTRLPIAMEGIYRWVAFLPSRANENVPVPNRYFGLFEDGRLKLRGIEARRHDTAPFIQNMQMGILETLAKVPAGEPPAIALPAVVADLRRSLSRLRAGEIPLKELLVTQRISRELADYKVPSPAARAAAQLERAGKPVRPGMVIRFLYTRGRDGVRAWDLPGPVKPAMVSVSRYIELFIRAAHTVFQPLGVEENTLRDWLLSNAGYFSPPGIPQTHKDIFSVKSREKRVEQSDWSKLSD